MVKYIKVEWPDYQVFMEQPNFREDCYYCADDNTYFIPEDWFDEVEELPKGYEHYTADFTHIKRGQNVLIQLNENDELKVVKAATNWHLDDCFPILFEDRNLLDGINCFVIAVEKND